MKKLLKSIACLGISAISIGAMSGCVPFFLAIPLFGKSYQELYSTFKKSDVFARLQENYQITYSYFTLSEENENIYNYEYAYSADGEQAVFKDLEDSTSISLFQSGEEKTFSTKDSAKTEYVTERSFADYPFAEEMRTVWDFISDDSISKTTSVNVSYLMIVNGYWGSVTLSDFQLSLRDKTYSSCSITFLTDKKGSYFQDVAISFSLSDAVYRICPPEENTPRSYEEQYEDFKTTI
jgi:hypothetical protein